MTPLERLTELFVSSGLNYAEFAGALGCSTRSVRRYFERGYMPPAFVAQLARIVSIEADAGTITVILRRGSK